MLNENHLQRLKIIAEDDIALEALREVFLGICDLNELKKAEQRYSNSELGQITRAYMAAEKLIKMALQTVEQYSVENKRETPKEIPAGL